MKCAAALIKFLRRNAKLSRTGRKGMSKCLGRRSRGLARPHHDDQPKAGPAQGGGGRDAVDLWFRRAIEIDADNEATIGRAWKTFMQTAFSVFPMTSSILITTFTWPWSRDNMMSPSDRFGSSATNRNGIMIQPRIVAAIPPIAANIQNPGAPK